MVNVGKQTNRVLEMKQYTIETFGDIGGLTQHEVATPQPQAGQVLVKMRAASLNYRDLMVVQGVYSDAPRRGLVPLSDGAGEVVTVGDGVSQWNIGDRVAGIFFQDWIDERLDRTKMKSDLGGGIDGVLTEYRVFDENGLVRLPEHLSFEEGATLPCAGVTAWHALERGRLKSDDTLLLLGTGGVSIFGLQFAKARGSRVIITSSSDEKLERARNLGADETINYNDVPNWDERIFELTGRNGADQVLEVGGNGTWEKSLRALRIGGTMSMIGGVSGFGGTVNPFPILFGSLNVHGIYVGSRAMFEAMNRVLESQQIRPVVDRVFAFDQSKAAYEYLESGAHFGKVVLSIP